MYDEKYKFKLQHETPHLWVSAYPIWVLRIHNISIKNSAGWSRRNALNELWEHPVLLRLTGFQIMGSETIGNLQFSCLKHSLLFSM